MDDKYLCRHILASFVCPDILGLGCLRALDARSAISSIVAFTLLPSNISRHVWLVPLSVPIFRLIAKASANPPDCS